MVDPWSRLDGERRERRAKNARQAERNLKAAEGQRVPGTVDLAAVQAGQAEQWRKAAGRGSSTPAPHHVDAALRAAAQSTASMGRFDDLRHREPERPKAPKSKASDGVERAKERQQADEPPLTLGGQRRRARGGLQQGASRQ